MEHRNAERPVAIRSFFIRKGNEHGICVAAVSYTHLAILIIKEPPASGLEQLIDLYSGLCFLCAHKTRIPLSKLTRLKGRFSVFVPPMQDGRSARLLSKRYEFDFSRTPSSYIGRGFFILRFSLTGQMPA